MIRQTLHRYSGRSSDAGSSARTCMEQHFGRVMLWERQYTRVAVDGFFAALLGTVGASTARSL